MKIMNFKENEHKGKVQRREKIEILEFVPGNECKSKKKEKKILSFISIRIIIRKEKKFNFHSLEIKLKRKQYQQ